MARRNFHPGQTYTVLETQAYIPASSARDNAFQQDSFQGTKDILSSWLRSKFGDDVALQLQESNSFTHTDPDGSSLEVIGDSQRWAFRALYPDKDGRSWITEASIEQIPSRKDDGHNRVNLAVAQRAVLAEGEQTVNPQYPEFFGPLVAEYPLTDGGWRLSPHPGIMVTGAAAGQLAKRLQDNVFNQPVIVFTPPEPGQRDSREQAKLWDELKARIPLLARQTAGVAHVVVFGPEVDGDFRRHMGADGLAAGSIRVYPPREAPDKPFSLYTAIQNRPHRWIGFTNHLARRLGQVSRTSHLDPERHLGPFLQMEAKITPPERETAPDPGVQAEQILESLIQITEQLEVIEAARDLEAEGTTPRQLAAQMQGYVARLSSYKGVNEELNDLVDETSAKAKHLRMGFLAAQYGITKPHEEKYEALAAWIDEHYAGRVVLSDDVKKVLKDPRAAKYNDINMVYAAVELMATEYYMMKTMTGRGEDLHRRMHEQLYKNRLEKLGLEDEPSLSRAAEAHFKDDYTVTVEGRQHFLGQHLKRGVSPDERRSLRIYYAWDDANRRVVIGGMFKHKPNTLTN